MNVPLPSRAELKRRIRIRLWSDMPNAALGLTPTVNAGVERWAKIEPIHGLTLRAGMQTGEMPTHLVWIPWLAGTKETELTASHIIESNGRRYRVIDALDVNGERLMVRISVKDLGAF